MSPFYSSPLSCGLALIVAFGSSARGADAGGAYRMPPPYHVATVAPLDATERLVYDSAKYAQYRVEFNGISGDRVPAFVYVPRDSGRAVHPAVLLQYGSGGNKSTYYIVELARQFAS